MSFPLSLVPRSLTCPGCGQIIVEQLSLARGFESLVAQVLDASLADSQERGYDAYDSSPFPSLTFQVKYAYAYLPPGQGYIQDKRYAKWYLVNRTAKWVFTGNSSTKADWYILFGISQDIVYPFVIPHSVWTKAGTISKRYNNEFVQFTITSRRLSPCGPSGHIQNKYWEFYARQWPEDMFYLIKRLGKATGSAWPTPTTLTQSRDVQQLSLF